MKTQRGSAKPQLSLPSEHFMDENMNAKFDQLYFFLSKHLKGPYPRWPVLWECSPPHFPKLQIFMTRASCRRRHLTPSLAVWFLFFLTMDVWRGKVLDCLLLQNILKGNECTNITGKKKGPL